jgi:hypothetical protein
MQKPQLKFINGFSQSAWKSLAIKSLRIGWVNGIMESAKNLSKSELETLLISGLFEDVFPSSYKDLDSAFEEIKNKDWYALCSRNTLHGRGYAQEFVDMERDACSFGYKQGDMILNEIRSRTKMTWINPRVYNCLYTWYTIKPRATEENYFREVLVHEWEGMPQNILDGHTYEGKCKKLDMCLLSGHYENHQVIGERVMAEGWEGIREEFMRDKVIVGKIDNPTLF